MFRYISLLSLCRMENKDKSFNNFLQDFLQFFKVTFRSQIYKYKEYYRIHYLLCILISVALSLSVYHFLIFQMYSTEEFYFYISFNLSLIFLHNFYFSSALPLYISLFFLSFFLSFYLSLSLSIFLSIFPSASSPFSPSYSFLSIPTPLFTPLTFNRQAFKHYSSGCWGPAVEHNHNTTRTQHNRTHHTHNTQQRPLLHSPFPLLPPPLPLLPCVSLSIKRNLVLISCLLLLLKFIEPILIFYLLTHAQDMAEEGHWRERGKGGSSRAETTNGT